MILRMRVSRFGGFGRERTWALGALLVVSCLDPTEVTVTVTSDMPCTQVAGTNIRIGSGDVSASVPATEHCTHGDTIGSVVVLPNASLSAAQIKVVTGTGTTTADQCDADPKTKGCIVARRTLSFVTHTKLSLPILMQQSCVDQPCDEKTTCVNGACQPIDQVDFDASAPDASPVVDASMPDASDASRKSVLWLQTTPYSGTTTNFPPIKLMAAYGDTFVVAFLTEYPVMVKAPANWTLQQVVSDNATENLTVFTHILAPNDPMGPFSTDSPTVSKRMYALFSIYRNVQSILTAAGGVTTNPLAVLPTLTGKTGSMSLGIYASIGATSFIGDMRATARNTAPGMFQQDEQLFKDGTTDALAVTANAGNIASVAVVLSP